MSTANNGGSAFPQNTPWVAPNQQTVQLGPQGGMTLRDYFAAKAMQGLLAADMEFNMSPDEVSKLSYFQADAMLRERNK